MVNKNSQNFLLLFSVLVSLLRFTMSGLTLTYFPLGARGFVARVCARASGLPFTDTRLTFPEWGPVKEEGKLAPLGQLPILSIDGVEGGFCQSIPISKYCAQVFSTVF